MVIKIKYNRNKERLEFAKRKNQYIRRNRILNRERGFLDVNQQLLLIIYKIKRKGRVRNKKKRKKRKK